MASTANETGPHGGRHEHEDDWDRAARAAHAGEVVMDEAFWEAMYRSRPTAWSGRPNPQLVAEATGLASGSALDVGCGEGADAVWLAERGWQVTAVDISATALERAAAHAAPDVAGRITWAQADLTDPSAPDLGTFDLVTAQFMHLPPAQLAALHARLAAAVSPDGTLLVVGHHPGDAHAGAGTWSTSDLMFTAEQVAATLDPRLWDVAADEARPRAVVGHDGEEGTVHDVVVVARRRAEGT